MAPLLTRFAEQMTVVMVVVAYRCLPFAVYVALGHGIRLRTRAIAITAYAVLLVSCYQAGIGIVEVVLVSLAWLLYFGAGSIAVYLLRDQLAVGRLSSSALFVLLAVLFVLFPSLLVPDARSIDAQLLGWDFMFSGYSYCVDTRGENPPRLRECLFFMLVNPVYVFAERGERIESSSARLSGGVRALFGILVVVFGKIVLLGSLGLTSWLSAGLRSPAIAIVALSVLLRASAEYYGHSGLASIQIGLMRVLGYRVPERYDHVYRATSPADLWRRWNLYLGSWARRYVFFPLALSLPRRLRAWPRNLGKGLAVLATFALIGLLHDYVLYTQSPEQPLPILSTAFFVLQGALLLLWVFAGRFRGATLARSARVFSPLLFWSITLAGTLLIFRA